MAKRGDKETKAIQGELFPSEESKRKLTARERAQKAFEDQYKLLGVLHLQIKNKLLEPNGQSLNKNLTIGDIKDLSMSLSRCVSSNRVAFDGLVATEQAASEALLANSWNDKAFEDLSDEELLKFI